MFQWVNNKFQDCYHCARESHPVPMLQYMFRWGTTWCGSCSNTCSREATTWSYVPCCKTCSFLERQGLVPCLTTRSNGGNNMSQCCSTCCTKCSRENQQHESMLEDMFYLYWAKTKIQLMRHRYQCRSHNLCIINQRMVKFKSYFSIIYSSVSWKQIFDVKIFKFVAEGCTVA